MMWPIVQLQSMPKMKMSYFDRSNQVPSMIKTRHGNDVTDHIGVVCVENDTNVDPHPIHRTDATRF